VRTIENEKPAFYSSRRWRVSQNGASTAARSFKDICSVAARSLSDFRENSLDFENETGLKIFLQPLQKNFEPLKIVVEIVKTPKPF